MSDVLVVDRKGLARKLGKKPKSFIVFELLQNAWDEDVTHVDVNVEKIPGHALCRITVTDDCPEGFQDLASVYTMFKDSKKAGDPTKRGRFELGEKLVLALAVEARIQSTKGSVIIANDERRQTRESREAGSMFSGVFRMNQEEFTEVLDTIQQVIPPRGITTRINGEELPIRTPVHTFETTLQTIKVDEEGNLSPTQRKTTVEVYAVLEGETAHIYEMGLPVVETGDKWHYNVCVAPKTRILRGDLQYVTADTLKKGDSLLAFDEHGLHEGAQHKRKFRSSQVTSVRRIRLPSYRLTFSDGTTLVCSENHQWLTLRGKNAKWMATKDMLVPRGKKPGSSVVRVLDSWETDASYDGGYLSGAFDGEGCLHQKPSLNPVGGVRNKLSYSQNDNEMLAQVRRLLKQEGFKVTAPKPRPKGERGRAANHHILYMSSRRDIIKFLGKYRPVRLLAKLNLDMFGLMPTDRKIAAKLVKKELLGPREVLSIETSSKTFIAEGLASHNCQRVPVNWERNNVPPSYKKTIRVEVLNAMHDKLTVEESMQGWVADAIDDERAGAEAVKTVITKRFGEKAVIYDPSDSEGTKIAMSKGYTVISGGSLSKGAWDNIRRFETVLPAGQVTPSPKVYNPDGHPENVIDENDWTEDMRTRAEFARKLFTRLTLGASCSVRIVEEPNVWWSANFGPVHGLCLNFSHLNKRWFALPNRAEEVLNLLVHEFGHHFSSDHFEEKYHDALTMMAARMTNLALTEPGFFTSEE